jgi:HAD superfamily hydrolase (TIGR01509 family)
MRTDTDNGATGVIGTDAEGCRITLPYPFIPGGAIFDCDGTLADTMPLHYRAWCDTLAPAGCPFPEETFYAWGGVTAEEIVERLNALHGRQMSPAETAVAKENLYRGLIPQVGPVAAIVAEARRLHGRCPLAVASGGMRVMVAETLEILGIRPLFDVVVTAEDVTRGKPDPEPFLLAAARLGVPAPECVVYEDSPAGLEAARRAGMRAVDVRPHLTTKRDKE